MHAVEIEWQQRGDLCSLSADGPFDLLLLIQLLPYLADPAALLYQGRALLRPGGLMVASFDHPVRDSFYDAEMEELNPYPVQSYHRASAFHWHFAADVPMRSFHRPLGDWIGLVVDAGFTLRKLVEAPAPAVAPLRLIPHTAIVVADLAR
jgi:hypothetical protein